MSYDFFAERDALESNRFLEDFELAVHSLQGKPNKCLQDRLRREDAQRIAKEGHGFPKEIKADTAKAEAKKLALQKSKDLMPRNSNFAFLRSSAEPPNATSFALFFEWVLASPFFSRGIAEFSAIDNPVSRDTLTNTPILHAAGAKGMLRGLFAMDKGRLCPDITYLFGSDRDIASPNDAQVAALHAGDVFFDADTSCELFSPHQRISRTVKLPVSFEMAPKGAKASWDMLFFDFTCEPERLRAQLLPVLKAVRDLIVVLGMSAKRSSGYGLGENLKVTFMPGKAVHLPDILCTKKPVDVDDAIKTLAGGK